MNNALFISFLQLISGATPKHPPIPSPRLRTFVPLPITQHTKDLWHPETKHYPASNRKSGEGEGKAPKSRKRLRRRQSVL